MSDKLNEIPISEIIGNTIAELRKSTGMTQREFSKTVGVSESSIAHYEQGITVPSADMLLKYANYFDVNIDYLFGRCRCKVKYSDLNSVLAYHMTISDMINVISKLSSKQKNYLYETIILLENEKNKY